MSGAQHFSNHLSKKCLKEKSSLHLAHTFIQIDIHLSIISGLLSLEGLKALLKGTEVALLPNPSGTATQPNHYTTLPLPQLKRVTGI